MDVSGARSRGWNIKLDKEGFVDMGVLSPDQCQGYGFSMNFEIIFRTQILKSNDPY